MFRLVKLRRPPRNQGGASLGRSSFIPHPSSFILLSAFLAAAPLLAEDLPPADRELPLQGESVVRFATVAEGQEVLRREDEFLRSLSRFDLESRLMTREGATPEKLAEYAAGEVRPWDEASRAAVAKALESLRPRLAPLRPLFPPTVLLVRTTGRDEGNAAYTRGAAVILPEHVTERPGRDLEKLLAHELFHILSRHQPGLRRELYGIVGFVEGPPQELPPSLRDRRITNPDAPRLDCRIELQIAGQPTWALPLMYASVEQYDPEAGGTFFRYLTFRLVLLDRDGDAWRVRETEGRPTVVDPQQVPDYFEQIGRNTGYIVHPEEVLADNFMHLVLETDSLPTPGVVERMRETLEK